MYLAEAERAYGIELNKTGVELARNIERKGNRMPNPYLPAWEYIPDGEPRVFGDRVYVYGSHDRVNSKIFAIIN